MVDNKPRLIYFDVYIKAEGIRMMLHYLKVDYIDKRLQFSDFMAAKKAGRFPSGQVPCWQTSEGDMLNQGHAIMKHLARKYNCEPTLDEMSQFTADWVLETIMDFWREPHGKKFFVPGVLPERDTKKMTDDLARCSEQLNNKLSDG